MLKKLQAALKGVNDKIGVTQAALQRHRRRHRRQRKRAYRNHQAAINAEKQADKLRPTDPVGAARLDKKAARCHHRAEVSHLRAQALIGDIKRLVQRLQKLTTSQAKLLAELVEYRKEHGVTIQGNQASGGTRRQRLKAIALGAAVACAGGKRPNFYSQLGNWDCTHPITGERYGERSDCSSFVTSVYWGAACPDPNKNNFGGGYTGTLVAGGRQVPYSERQPGDLVIYGGGAGHHVEMYVGPGDVTIGHGSPPVDKGTVNLFGDGDFRIFRYV